MINKSAGFINLCVRFVHYYNTFYHVTKIPYKGINSAEALDEILSSGLDEVFYKVTATDDGNDVLITIVAPYWFHEKDGSDAKIVTAIVNYLTDKVRNKMSGCTDILLFEEYYQEMLEGINPSVELVQDNPWIVKRRSLQ